MTTLRMYGTAPESIVDGPGLRFSVFVQGCTHHCPGCHNPESQPSDGGYLCEPADIVHEIHKNKLIHGVTLTGGEPFEQVEGVFELAQLLKAEGYDLWIYSGYLFEDLMAGHPHEKAPDLLALCDVLVDGPFVEALHSYVESACDRSSRNAQERGSSALETGHDRFRGTEFVVEGAFRVTASKRELRVCKNWESVDTGELRV